MGQAAARLGWLRVGVVTCRLNDWLVIFRVGAWCSELAKASDVIRYALTSLQERLPEEELREAVIKHVHSEAKLYPGRARRGCHPVRPRTHEAPDLLSRLPGQRRGQRELCRTLTMLALPSAI